LASATVDRAVADTDISFSLARLPGLREELDDLADLKQSLKSRENDTLTRKKMAYRSDRLRKNK